MKKLNARLAHRGEEGVTVAEVMVVTLLISIVTVIFLNTLVSVQNNMGAQERRSKNNDQARQAMFSLDREIRSGNLIYNPATESIPNYELVVYTQANATTRVPPNLCVQWRIDGNKRLLVRRWDPANPAGVSSWQTVAENVVNRVNNVPAFTLAGSGSGVNVVIQTNTRHTPAAKETVRVASSITARNVTPSTNCATRPAG